MKNKFWTLRYTLINMSYFAVFCTIHAYAAVFLLDKGFTNTQVGLALAIANILSVFGQPLVAGLVDKPGKVTNRNVIMTSVLLMALGCFSLLFIRNIAVLIFAIFVLIYTIQLVHQPIMIAMNFEYQKAGCNINFGLSRGLGSAGFAMMSAITGVAVAKNGTDFLLVSSICLLIFMFLITFFFQKPVTTLAESKEEIKSDEEATNKFTDFVKKYPMFMLLMLGSACCFFAHNMINDFMIQIIRSLNGSETQLGYSTFLQGILELPVMALIAYVLRKVSAGKLLVFSAVSFLIKTLILVFSTSMVGMYISQCFQMFAYAVFIPVAAYYADKVMSKMDQVKGQAYINVAITVGGVFSNLICGRILDNMGVKPMLIIGCIVCTLGVFITLVSVVSYSKKTQTVI
ncbi:MAG: MFS transporter [Lachnospiraceae bacterium]|nr:MFS transporter [Lachnospiraceae bacterium]